MGDTATAAERSWCRHLDFEPEEARLLGLAATGRKSLRRLGEQVDFYRDVASAPDGEASVALRRLARLAVRRFDRGDEHAALERMLLPRLVEMDDAAGFVDEHAELLREVLRRGAPPPIELVTHFVDVRAAGDPGAAARRSRAHRVATHARAARGRAARRPRRRSAKIAGASATRSTRGA